MTPDKISLKAWTAKWVLVDGEVFCVQCKRHQPVTHSDAEFEHAPGCEADVYPWVALHDALDHERG